MKFSGIATVGGLLGVASAGGAPDTCAPASTVYQTVTVTAPPYSGYSGYGGYGGKSGVQSYPPSYPPPPPAPPAGGPQNYGGSSYVAPPYVSSGADKTVSVDYGYSKTSVWNIPTGPAQSKDCEVIVYEDTTVTIIIINISVTIINGQTVTVTSTVTDATTVTTTPPGQTTVGSTTTSTGAAATHSVVVGADGLLKYKEEANHAEFGQLNANIGDLIVFDFNSTNHTVTQSSFLEPCTPLPGGFDTGFNQFNDKNKTIGLTRNFTVNTDKPLWFYCAQPKGTHCQKGMVLGINPAGKFPEFLNRATSLLLSTGTAPPVASGTGVSSINLSTGTAAHPHTTHPVGPGPVKFTPPAQPSVSKRVAGYWAA